MLKKFFNEVLSIQPSFRSFLGDNSTNGDYENIASEEYKQNWIKMIRRYKNLIDKPNHTMNLDMMSIRWIIANEHDLLRFPDEWMYITSYDNPILQFIVEDTYIYPLKTEKDIANLISRTQKRIPFIVDVMKAMKDHARKNSTIPKMICEKLIQQVTNLLSTQSYYVKIPTNLDSSKYIKVVDTEYVPILYEFLEFLKVYRRQCRKTIGLCYINHGKEMYETIAKSSTTLEITPEEIHEYGKQELKRLYKSLATFRKDLQEKMGISASVLSNRQLFKKIMTREEEYFKKSRDILEAYKLEQEKIRKTVIPKYFGETVDRYLIKPVPKLVENSTPGAYYSMPSIKSKRRGTVFINTGRLKENPRYTVNVLSLHEGAPGHHYQYQYMKQHHMPLYRMYGAGNDAYAEGWALYCEGFIDSKDVKEMFGRWIYDMLRTVRLIVDTGVHYYGWSYKRALDYMKKHVLLDTNEIVVELDRYICDPGQALSYKIGERVFIEERDRYIQNKLGDIKDYHREILECGPMPLDVLKHKLRQRIGCQNK
jgi:uncharacterized protein (DUF885 family)